MPKVVTLLVAAGLIVFSGAVVSSEPVEAQQSYLRAEFQSAAREYNVPAEVLMAMGYVNTRWETPSAQSRDSGWGVMHLVESSSTDTLGQASQLTGIPREQLRYSRYQNIRGAAALLAQYQGGGAPANLNGWYEAVAEMGGGAMYANQVYSTLQSGASATISTGESVYLAPQHAAPRQLYSTQGSADYLGAEWYPADEANFTQANRPTAPPINKIVIHVTQASYSSALNWFQDPKAQTSSHYVVRSSDGQIAQSVSDMNIAWHAGAWSYNRTSVGIEHEGYINDPKWFTPEMYHSSARLAAYLCDKYGIPIDRRHIVGHNEIPNSEGSHTDPGPNWDWGAYMSLVRQYAGAKPGGRSGGGRSGGNYGGGSGGYTQSYAQIIDNADEATSGKFSSGKNWKYSEANSERYFWNYRYSKPRPSSSTANYEFDIPARDRYTVYGWWPSHRIYNTATPIGVKTASGWEWTQVNQSRTGGRWVSLGTHRMTPEDGWNVKVSRWAGGNGYVIADAIKVVRR